MAGQDYSFVTVGTVIDQAVAEAIGSTASSLTALQDAALIRQVDWINRSFLNAAYTRHGNDGWSWMVNQRDSFATKDSTTLSANSAEGALSVTVTSAASLPASGQLYIRTSKGAIEFVPFSAVVGTTVTTSALSMAHSSGEHVELCYPLSSTFGKARHLMVNTVEYFQTQTEALPTYGTYALNGNYVVFPYDIGQSDITLVFDKKPTTLSTGSSAADRALSTNIPNDFHRYAVEMLRSYILTVRRKREDSLVAKKYADECLMDALSYDISSSSTSGLRPNY